MEGWEQQERKYRLVRTEPILCKPKEAYCQPHSEVFPSGNTGFTFFFNSVISWAGLMAGYLIFCCCLFESLVRKVFVFTFIIQLFVVSMQVISWDRVDLLQLVHLDYFLQISQTRGHVIRQNLYGAGLDRMGFRVRLPGFVSQLNHFPCNRVTMENLCNIPVPQFSPLQNGDKMYLLMRISEVKTF